MGHFDITWQPTGLPRPAAPPSSALTPKPPMGPTLDFSGGYSVACKVILPWPAEGAGCYAVTCRVCRQRIACTTTGQATDPTAIMVACRPAPDGQQYAAAMTGERP
jgi:hypothetical protein